MNTIRLGYKARDKVSGFEGVVHSKSEFLTGNVQYALQPPAKDGALPDTIAFDAHQLEEIKGSKTVDFHEPEPEALTSLRLGEKVKDMVTKFVGVAIRRVTFLNGCVYYAVIDEDTKGDKGPQEMFMEWKRLDTVGAGVTKAIAAKGPETQVGAPKRKGPGGPNTRGMPQRG